MAAHARLSPSSSDRWIACPGSVKASERVPDRGNVYAALGTAAHKLLEMSLVIGDNPENFIGHTVEDHEVDEDMANAVGMATDYINRYLVQNPKAKVVAEHTVNLLRATGRKDLWGTLDVALDNYGNDPDELVVIDYKHGRLPVPVERNPQLMLYALGYRSNTRRTFSRYTFVVIQPRSHKEERRPKEWSCDNAMLNEFQELVRKAAAATDLPDAPRHPGDHCTWCPALARCPAVANRNLQTAFTDFTVIEADMTKIVNARELTVPELVRILNILPVLNAWSAAVWEDCVRRVWSGETFPGWKPVLGKSRRMWAAGKEEDIMDTLDLYLPHEIVAPRRLAPLTDIEKAMKRTKQVDAWEGVADEFVSRTVPPAHIAPEADPRPRANIQAQFSPIGEDNGKGKTEG